MGRSLWFRVYSLQLLALFRLAFAAAPHFLLNLAGRSNSPVHSSIGTPSHVYSAPTACRHTVSGSLSFPSRGSFHLSLTVLCAIGLYQCFALEGGPPCFPQDSSCLVVLWIPARSARFRLPEFHRLCSAFPDCSAILPSLDAGPQPRSSEDVRFGLFPVRSPLLRESRLITLPPAT